MARPPGLEPGTLAQPWDLRFRRTMHRVRKPPLSASKSHFSLPHKGLDRRTHTAEIQARPHFAEKWDKSGPLFTCDVGCILDENSCSP